MSSIPSAVSTTPPLRPIRVRCSTSCAALADGVQLVNLVRSAEQDAILKAIGANHIVNSTAPNFPEQLAAAVSATGATLSVAAPSNTLV